VVGTLVGGVEIDIISGKIPLGSVYDDGKHVCCQSK